MLAYFEVTTTRVTFTSAALTFSGDLDLVAAQEVSQLIRKHLNAARIWIRLDASAAASVDEAALDELAAAARLARQRGGGLSMCGVDRERLFRPSGTDRPGWVRAR